MREGQRKIRYAVVGLGQIAQRTVMPAFRNTPNAELIALVTEDQSKARELARRYDVPETHSYDGYSGLLASGDIDAVYLATPNRLHKDFTVQAARAGVHVLCEKPMAATSADCEEMIRTTRNGGVQLMIAHRLHFEPANLRAIGQILSGRIGEPRVFASLFSRQVGEGTNRLPDQADGPLMDMGVDPINAARCAFRAEPVEVIAFGGNNGSTGFADMHESASVILRFPGDRLATFTCSFGAASIDQWRVVGTRGWLELAPGFEYHKELRLRTNIDGEENEERFGARDQFGAEILYFSQCIRQNREPEPSGREGLADVRIVEAALESMRTGSSVQLPPFDGEARPDERLRQEAPPVTPQVIGNASPPNPDE